MPLAGLGLVCFHHEQWHDERSLEVHCEAEHRSQNCGDSSRLICGCLPTIVGKQPLNQWNSLVDRHLWDRNLGGHKQLVLPMVPTHKKVAQRVDRGKGKNFRDLGKQALRIDTAKYRAGVCCRELSRKIDYFLAALFPVLTVESEKLLAEAGQLFARQGAQ